jgi:hypothetical protein
MTYTKEQKKQMRKQVYYLAKLVQNNQKELVNTCNYYYNSNVFYECIKQGEYMEALKGHKLLIEQEEYMLDEIVFDPEKYNYNSENLRKACQNIKNGNNNRKYILKQAMICDATVGYWKLSK